MTTKKPRNLRPSQLQKKTSITLCMIVKDEEELLPGCLESVQELVDEIIIVDTGSADRTPQIAAEYGAKVIHYEWCDDFSKARNIGLEQAHGHWILFLDADEQLVDEDIHLIKKELKHASHKAYFLTVINLRGETASQAIEQTFPSIRLFRNLPEHRFTGIIHEQVSIPQKNGNIVGVITARIKHYGYLDSMIIKRKKRDRNAALLEKSSDNRQNLVYLADEDMSNSQFKAALSKYVQAYQEFGQTDNMNVPGTVLRIVCCCRELGREEEALQWIGRGLKRWHDYTDLEYLRASILLDRNDYESAKQSFTKCLALGKPPGNYDSQVGIGTWAAWQGIGFCQRALGRHYEAAAAFRKALAINPQDALSVGNLCQLMLSFGERRQEILRKINKISDVNSPIVQEVLKEVLAE